MLPVEQNSASACPKPKVMREAQSGGDLVRLGEGRFANTPGEMRILDHDNNVEADEANKKQNFYINCFFSFSLPLQDRYDTSIDKVL